MTWVCLLLGGLLAGPIWIGLARWWMRRTIWRTRRIAASAREREHLVEVGSLTGGLAHELKNPLSTIKVNLQLLIEDLDSPGADEQQRRWLRRLYSVDAEVTRLQETLDDFLRYAGHYELTLSVIDLRTVLDDLTDFFSPQAQAAGVRVRAHLGDRPMPVNIDVDLFKQAMLNLMINGQQAMPDGGDLILRAEAAGKKARVEVIDTGVGIEPDAVKKIFQAYYTTKRGGSGLGLPTARRIIKAHDGHIAVDSAPGKGTRFVIELPLHKG